MTTTANTARIDIPHGLYNRMAHQTRSDYLAQAFADSWRAVRESLANGIGPRGWFKGC
jgi:hypothetical protein